MMTDANDLTLRNDVTGALIAGGHWHGGGNYEICATIAALCKAANERDDLRNLLDIAMGQSSDFKEEAKYLRTQNATLIDVLRAYIWLVRTMQCCGFIENDATNKTIDELKQKAEAAIAAAEGGGK